MKIGYVITSLATGGAQTALFRLVSAGAAAGWTQFVVSLAGEGVFGPRIEALGVPVTSLHMRRGVPDPRAIAALVRVLRRERPHVVQSWMYHANLLASPAAAIARIPIVWGIRHADVDPQHGKRLTALTNIACARLSSIVPARIVCCARSARDSHETLGYAARRMVVIPNGFDLEKLAADPAAGAAVRTDLRIAPDAPVVGLLARYHPDKDHDTFLDAARLTATRRPDVAFLLAGEDVTWENTTLAAAVDARGLRARVRLLGVRHDVPALLSAMDVLASSSRSEAFPQVLGEAMACGVPCVATDCGDSREVVGQAGRIVPCGNATALAAAVVELLAMRSDDRKALGAAAREHVRAHFELRGMVQRYADLYSEVSARARSERP